MEPDTSSRAEELRWSDAAVLASFRANDWSLVGPNVVFHGGGTVPTGSALSALVGFLRAHPHERIAVDPDASSPRDLEPQATPDDVRAAQDRRLGRDAPHIIALVRQGMPVNTAALARAAAVTAANEQVRTDGLQNQLGELQDQFRALDRTLLKLSFQLYVLLWDIKKRRGQPDIPEFPLWLQTLPALENRPNGRLTHYFEEARA